MASHRKPGVAGQHRHHRPLKDGTLPRTHSPSPGILNTLEAEAIAGWKWFKWIIASAAMHKLFDSCLNPETSVSDAAWKKAAADLDVEVEVMKAVAQVESKKNPFDEEGHPTILFERHYFHRFTHGKYDKKHPKISNAAAGGYGKFREQYTKLQEAYSLDPSAALKSASWGKFQIMGSNFKEAGFDSVEEMVASMMRSEQNQLDAFVTYVKSDSKMQDALKNKKWADFARRYNGSGYKKNNYDKNLESAYEALKPAPPKQDIVPPPRTTIDPVL